MLEEPPDYALVSRPKESFVNGNVLVKNSPDTHIGDKYYNIGPVTLICPNQDSEVTLKPGLLENAVDKANELNEKTDNSDEVCIANEQKFRIRKLHILAGAAVLLLIAIVAALAVLLSPTKHSGPSPPPDSVKIITRKEWSAENSTELIPKLTISPAPYVIIGHTASDECFTTDTCKTIVKNIQAFHIAEGYGDIGYNFLVGGDGNAYEGLGWDLHGGHTIPFNARSIGVAFIGNFIEIVPPSQQVKAAQLLLEEGVTINKLTVNYKLFGQLQVIPTESPGEKVMEIIKTWAHWAVYDPKVDGP